MEFLWNFCEERWLVLWQSNSSLRMGTDEERGSEILRACNVGEIIKVSEAFLKQVQNEVEQTPTAV
jgi:hypothetical protein